MNGGAFGENFPYSNFHDLNMDWIIDIAKNFLDQYTHIQDIIADGEQSLRNLTEEGLAQLDEKADALETLLQEWYNTHSEDIAQQLANALASLNSWYTEHQNYLDEILIANQQTFSNEAFRIARTAAASIPSDYTSLYNTVMFMKNALGSNTDDLLELLNTPSYSDRGVTVINNGDGSFTVHGTATGNTAIIVTPEILLPAGTYRAGYFTNSPINLQIRKYEGGADAGNIVQTTTRADFTVTSQTTVVGRLFFSSGVTYDTTIFPALMLTDNWNSFHANYVANDTIARERIGALENSYFTMEPIPNNTDINNLTTPGMYRGLSTYTYTNINPLFADTNFLLQLIKMTNTPYTLAIMSSFSASTPYIIATRVYSGSPASWGDWRIQFNGESLKYGIIIPDGTDLDTIVDKQIYRAVASYTYTHTPEGFSGNYTVDVVPFTANYIMQRAVNYGSRALKIATRIKSGSPSVWSDWNIQIDVDEMTAALSIVPAYSMESFTRRPYLSRGANTGHKLTVVSYNVANYDNDTSRHLPDDKLVNLKKFLMNIDPDFIMMQEDTQYIDGNSQEATRYIYNPNWPFVAGNGGTTIRSKINFTASETLRYANGRVMRYAIFQIDDITLLAISTHPTPVSDPDGQNKREAQYRELFRWLTGQVAMETYTGGQFVMCPTYTHAIIGIDANSATEIDKSNLTNYAESNGFTLANGGALGWCTTHPENRTYPNMALDNIIVSNNIIINSFATYLNQFSQLYSDHVPISASLTLL